jgi:hypothetical protein
MTAYAHAHYEPGSVTQCKHSNEDRVALRGFRKRALGYASAAEAVWDDYFKGCWSTA